MTKTTLLKTLSILITFAMLLAFLPCGFIVARAENGTCGTNLTWTLEGGVLTISGTGKMTNYTYSNSAPWKNKSFTTVIINNSVTSIGEWAFYNCTGLTSVTIPNSVTSIGKSAFSSCTGLTSVYITDIATWCAISFGSGSNPLSYAHNLYLNGELVTDCVIPDSVTSIGSSAFSGCTGLTSVTIPASVTSIGSGAFSSCTGLTSVTIGNSVKSIGSAAFSRCAGLTSITIPDSVTSIDFHAFLDCTGLTSVTIGNSVKSIGESAFRECSSLETINVAENNPVYHSAGNCLIETKSKTLILGCKNSVIPSDDSVTSIGDLAFAECTGLTSITIPDSVTYIDEGAFCECTGLTSVTIGNGVTSIGSGAFDGCSGLTSVTIPDSVTSIDWYAFEGCTSLTSVTIPDSVTYIGTHAFDIQKYDYDVGNYLYYPLDVTLCVYINSYAHKYADDNGFRYEFIRPSRIEVTTLPDKLSYLESKDLLDVTGGVITAYYDNDTSEEISMTADMVTGFDNRCVGVQTLTVTYEGLNATFDVEIIAKTLTDMRITSLPNKTRYIEYKGGLDLSGGKYTLYYNNDTTETLNITADMVSGFDITTIGRQTLTVTYGDFTDTFEVEVVPKSISRIAVTRLPDKTSYSEAKDSFDATGGVVTVYYNNDTSESAELTADMVSGFDNSTPGSQTLTVVYQGYMTTFNVTIVARTLVSIAATRLPDKVTYHEGEEFDPTGLEVTAYYDNDTEEIITDYGIFGYYSTPGERAITVTYGGKYYSFGVVVLANVMKGDPDGDGRITVADALAALRIAARLMPETEEMVAVCDTDGDGRITVADALKILRVAARLISQEEL